IYSSSLFFGLDMKANISLVAIALGAWAVSCTSDNNPGYSPYESSGGSSGTGGGSSPDASANAGSSGNSAGSVVSASAGRCPYSNFTILQDGGCACAPGTDKVCDAPGGDGGPTPTCIDSTSDPNNCGGCGTKCDPTVACIAGKCGKAPTALVPA